MLQPIKLANAATVVSVACHIIYLIVVAIAPSLIYIYMASMSPGYDFSAIESGESVNLGFALLGIVLVAISVWVFVYVTIWLYNRLAR